MELILKTTFADVWPHMGTVPLGDIVNRLREAQARGWSQRVIASEVGVSHYAVQRWANGRTARVRVDVAKKVDRFLRKIDGLEGPSGRSRADAKRKNWDQYLSA